jgi:hypothetical protein
MMGWEWRLRTAVSTGLLFIPGRFAMCTVVRWYWLRLTPNLSTTVLWQPPVLSGSPVSRDISGSPQYWLVSCQQRPLWSKWESGRRKWEFSLPSPWDFKRSFMCHRILWYGISGFTSHLKEGVLRIFIALKNPSPWLGSNPQPLGSVASTLATTPKKATYWTLTKLQRSYYNIHQARRYTHCEW